MRMIAVLSLAVFPVSYAAAQDEQTAPQAPGGTAEAVRSARLEAAGGAARLKEHFPPDLLPDLLVARLIGPDGQPADGPAPQTNVQDDGRVACTWTVEIYFDTKRFYEELVPALDETLTQAASGSDTAESIARQTGRMHITLYPIGGRRSWRSRSPAAAPPEGRAHVFFFLSTGRSDRGDTERFQWYRLDGQPYVEAIGQANFVAQGRDVMLSLDLLDEGGGVVWSEAVSPWKEVLVTDGRGNPAAASFAPFFLTREEIDPAVASNTILSPRFGADPLGYDRPVSGRGHCDTIVKQITAILPPEDVDRISKARLWFTKGKPIGE